MRRTALALAAAACALGAKQPEAATREAGHGKPRKKYGKPYPETKAECGVVMFGTGDDYIQYSARNACLLYTSPSPRDATLSRMPSSA